MCLLGNGWGVGFLMSDGLDNTADWDPCRGSNWGDKARVADKVTCWGAVTVDKACFCLLADTVTYLNASHGCLADHGTCSVSYWGGDG